MAARKLMDAEDPTTGSDSETGSGHGNDETRKALLEEARPDNLIPIGENIYALATASMVRDYVGLHMDKERKIDRVIRMIFSLSLVLLCLVLQLFLLQAVYGLLCQSAVHAIRDDYSKYQLAVYGPEHVRVNEHGSYRGVDHKFLNASNFYLLTESEKHNICQIPLAHATYLFAILFVWTMTCVAEIRNIIEHTVGLLALTPTAKTVQGVIKRNEEDQTVLVVGLTAGLKAILAVLVLLPRFLSVGILCFLGCRWLVATNNLSDLLLNALALEFMLVLKELLYTTMASQRNKYIAENTLVHHWHVGDLSITSIVGLPCLVFGATVGWVALYIYYFQSVLPEYNWDVREVCSTWDGAVHMPKFFGIR